MKTRKRISVLVVVGVLLSSLVLPRIGRVQAQTTGATASTISPVSYATQKGSTDGGPASVLAVMDQSGAADDPASYVLFATPNSIYSGNQVFQMPAGVSGASIGTMNFVVNYKGPLPAKEKWNWSLYNYAKKRWVQIGNNRSVKSATNWVQLSFNVAKPANFVSSTGEMRAMMRSGNATGDAKIDYEAISFTLASPSPTATSSPTPTSTPNFTPTPTSTPQTPPPSSGAVYYVSPQGSDSNPGTLAQPWKTIPKAVSMVTAGDTIYLRGGIYYLTGTVRLDGSGPNGTKDKPIRLWNYPGETPILDGSNLTRGVNGITLANKDYWHVKGIEVRNIKQSSAGEFFIVFYVHNVTHTILENLNIHHNGAIGMGMDGNVDGDLVLNSDFHHNDDYYANGGNADGMGFAAGTGTATLEGNRMWLNSDDGMDSFNFEGKLILKNNWVFWNGYYVPDGKPDSARIHIGDGNGFKLGQTQQTSSSVYYVIENNLLFENWQSGLSQEDAKKAIIAYNNIAYKNVYSCAWGEGFWLNPVGDSVYNLPHILRNNIAYNNGSTCSSKHDWGSPNIPLMTQDHNSWNMSYAASDNDFESVDSSVMTGPRNSDGSLPDVPFLKLKSTSKYIDAGFNVGLPYTGSAPDLGAYEYAAAAQANSSTGSTSDLGFTSVVDLFYRSGLDKAVAAQLARFLEVGIRQEAPSFGTLVLFPFSMTNTGLFGLPPAAPISGRIDSSS